MSYDSDPNDPPLDESQMTPPRSGEPWLPPLDALKQLGLAGDEAAGNDPAVAPLLASLSGRANGGLVQAWRVAIDVALGMLAAKLGDPGDESIDDEDCGLYCGGWMFEGGSLMIDSVESDVTVTVTRYRPMWHWTWQIAGQVSPPYAPVVRLPDAVQEAVARLVEEVPGARRRGA